MIWLINLFRGWLDVRISGRWPERFLNICSQHGIEFWDLKVPEAGVLIVRVRVGQYRLMRKLSADALCEAKVEAEQGVPFLVWRLRKRYMLVGGAFLFLLIVFLGSRHIWQITITGNERISETEILAALDYAGIRPGVSVSKIDIGSAEDKVLLRLDDLLWVALNITGSAIEAEVHERIAAPKIVDTKTACNVVAKRAGIIKSIVVTRGSAAAGNEETVDKGQLLVSGVVARGSSVRLLHAAAEVTARTWYTLSAEMPAVAAVKSAVQSSFTRSTLIIAGRRINLFGQINLFAGSSNLHQGYDKIIKRVNITLPGGISLPVQFESVTYVSHETGSGSIDTSMADIILRERLLKQLESIVGDGEILTVSYESKLADGVFTVTLTAECLEDIAETALIPHGSANGSG